jgi:hypothetical protein
VSGQQGLAKLLVKQLYWHSQAQVYIDDH